MKRFAIMAICAIVMATVAKAQLKLPAVMSDNMVMQQENPAKIWGWAKPNSAVTVELGRQSKRATADAQGKWRVTFEPLPANKDTLEMKVASGGETLTVKNILVGEVWLCSGQSNMQWSLQQTGGKGEADNELRLFVTKFVAPQKPQEDCEGKWVLCTPQSAAGFSAVGYYFGRDLRKALGRPVGMIQSAQGATAAECWMSRAALESDPVMAPIVKVLDAMPKDPKGWDPHLPTGLFNGEIMPFSTFALRGFIWYQGETNAGRAFQYRTLFPALITSWRKAWGEELPFYFVQLANHLESAKEPGDASWAELREAQALALKLPATGMAVAIDVGEAKNIHPGNKDIVGNRLARQALAKTYKQKIDFDGPVYTGMKIEGAKIRVNFDKKPIAKNGKLKHFAIAGADKKFVWADAEIDGNSVLVSSAAIASPVAVRYAWANNPDGCNLYSEAGLPASPFRTDNWAGATDTSHLNMKIPEPPAPRVSQPIPAGDFLGNTIHIKVGQNIERPWNEVKTDGYAYAIRQALDNGETRIWLPYGNENGLYFDAKGVKFTNPVPGSVPQVLSEDAKTCGYFTWKFKFDKPVSALRLMGGYGEFNLNGAVAGAEYSTDNKMWKKLFEIDRGGNQNPFIKPDQAKADGLNTTDLYLRIYTRNKANPADPNVEAAWFKCWTGGDPSWGDASRTFYDRQWQLWVK